ncbi:MAG: helix-hairpin-helix domain-containing protein [Pirellulaceae bacterium]
MQQPENNTNEPPPEFRWGWRRSDQVAIAATMSVVVLLGLGRTLYDQTRSQRVVDIETAAPFEIRYQVDINVASWDELAQLPGIGEVLAGRIVESRQQDGPFRDNTDLERVRGIGPRTMQRLQPFLVPMPESETLVSEPIENNAS